MSQVKRCFLLLLMLKKAYWVYMAPTAPGAANEGERNTRSDGAVSDDTGCSSEPLSNMQGSAAKDDSGDAQFYSDLDDSDSSKTEWCSNNEEFTSDGPSTEPDGINAGNRKSASGAASSSDANNNSSRIGGYVEHISLKPGEKKPGFPPDTEARNYKGPTESMRTFTRSNSRLCEGESITGHDSDYKVSYNSFLAPDKVHMIENDTLLRFFIRDDGSERHVAFPQINLNNSLPRVGELDKLKHDYDDMCVEWLNLCKDNHFNHSRLILEGDKLSRKQDTCCIVDCLHVQETNFYCNGYILEEFENSAGYLHGVIFFNGSYLIFWNLTSCETFHVLYDENCNYYIQDTSRRLYLNVKYEILKMFTRIADQGFIRPSLSMKIGEWPLLVVIASVLQYYVPLRDKVAAMNLTRIPLRIGPNIAKCFESTIIKWEESFEVLKDKKVDVKIFTERFNKWKIVIPPAPEKKETPDKVSSPAADRKRRASANVDPLGDLTKNISDGLRLSDDEVTSEPVAPKSSDAPSDDEEVLNNNVGEDEPHTSRSNEGFRHKDPESEDVCEQRGPDQSPDPKSNNLEKTLWLVGIVLCITIIGVSLYYGSKYLINKFG